MRVAENLRHVRNPAKITVFRRSASALATPPTLKSPFQENASSMSSFAQFNLDSRIMSAIERIGYKEPTPIQLQAIPW